MAPSLPTPSTSHLNFSTIYEPAEDSFLFLDTLSSDSESAFLKEHFPLHYSDGSLSASPLVVEVGTGSGVILAFVTAHAKTIFGRTDVLTLGVDVNEAACRGAVETVKQAVKDVLSTRQIDGDNSRTTNGEAQTTSHGTGICLGTTQSSLTSSFRRNSIDILLFNPPYVPTETLPSPSSAPHASRFDEESHLLALSYAGGVDGMEVTERLLKQLPWALSNNGVAYVLFCARNKPEEVLERIVGGWNSVSGRRWGRELVGRTGGKGGWERLEIWRIWKRALMTYPMR